MPGENTAGGEEERQRDGASKKGEAAAVSEEVKAGGASLERGGKEAAAKESQAKATSAKGTNKNEDLSATSKKVPPKKAYGVVPPPSFMLSEMVQEDPMFSSFQYMALTECDDRVYGYGTLSTEETDPQGDEGMVDFDPATNRFHLIYCTKLATGRRSSEASVNERKSAGARRSPGCRQRATLAARRIKTDRPADAQPPLEEPKNASSAADRKGEGKKRGKGGGSSDLPWRLLLFGGLDRLSGNLVNDVWEFRLPPRQPSGPLLALPSVGSWRELPVTGKKPAPRADHAVCLSPSKVRMYVFGGIGQDDKLLNDCFVLTENNQWFCLSCATTEAASALRPAPRRCHTLTCGTASSGGVTLYLFGGDLSTRGREACNDLWKYSVQQNSWMRITLAAGTPPIARYDHASAFANNKVWIVGGLSPGWIGATELKDLYGFDVTALFWFQCVISLGKVQQALPRFRPLAFVPATRSFFIFGCSEHKRYQQTQAAVCALIPVCTMESLVPLQRLNASVRKGIPETADLAGVAGESVQTAEKRLPALRQRTAELAEKVRLLQQKLCVIAEKQATLGRLMKQLANTALSRRLDDIEKLSPTLEKQNKTVEDLDNVIQQVRTMLNTKASAADVAFLSDAVEQIREVT